MWPLNKFTRLLFVFYTVYIYDITDPCLMSGIYSVLISKRVVSNCFYFGVVGSFFFFVYHLSFKYGCWCILDFAVIVSNKVSGKCFWERLCNYEMKEKGTEAA